MTATFYVFLSNFGYSLEHTAADLEGAVAIARRAGFECSILRDGERVATWSILSGLRMAR